MKQNDGFTIYWQTGIAEVAENGIFSLYPLKEYYRTKAV
jgi:hypothetical protein